MRAEIEFLLGQLDRGDSVCVTRADFDLAYGPLLRRSQENGFLSREPGTNPIPSCPHCGAGVPHRLAGRLVCSECLNTVDPQETLLWRFDAEAFFRFLAGGLGFRGGVRRIDDSLWELGSWMGEDGPYECFFRRPRPLTPAGRMRLSAFRNVLVFFGLKPPSGDESSRCRMVSLLELVPPDGIFRGQDILAFLRPRGRLRFEAHSGALWAGDTWLGEVPPGSKEYFFLDSLAREMDHFVPYADLKRDVQRQAGTADETEEATFCQGLKSRIKKKWIPTIDWLIATTNKGDGYRLRGYAEPSLLPTGGSQYRQRTDRTV